MSAQEKDTKKPETKTKKKTSKKKRRLIILASILGFILVFLIAAVEFTSHSGFCASCHYMTPFFESWEQSSHSEFECSECHYPPGGGISGILRKKIEGLVMVGRYWTKLYVKSKPWAEIKDESCLKAGCHDKRLLEGTVDFKNVVFDHKVHFEDLRRGKQLQCTSCHSQIVQGQHITVTSSSCFICHFKESEHYPRIAECSHCHTQDKLVGEGVALYDHTIVFQEGYSCDKCHSHVITGDGDVPRENCYKCHGERERLEKYEDTDLMHRKHISENKIECNQCHMEIQHKVIKDIDTIADCKSCHTDFHKVQTILYLGEGGKGGAHPRPNVMLERGLSCKGCHMFHETSGSKGLQSDTLVAEAESCEACHGKGFAKIMKEWEVSTSKRLTQIERIQRNVLSVIQRSSHANKDQAAQQMEDAAFNIDVVSRGKSVHNVSYSQELLATAYKSMLEALKLVESSYKPETFTIESKGVPGECSVCHSGIVDINVPVFGLQFPHEGHIVERGIACDQCHSNVRRHGDFVGTKQICAGCHHTDPEKDCSQCHKTQTALYRGGQIQGLDIPKDMMAEGEVECVDCHLSDSEKIYRSDKSRCAVCHDEEYADMFTTWQKTIRELSRDISTARKDARNRNLTGEDRSRLAGISRIVASFETDGSLGVHNFMFIEEMLSGFLKEIQLMGKSE
jgi:nitrate/TMAO reductase-like tetraheme cytochrome c subunit